MNFTIKPLIPQLARDYFDFFENRAFTDNSPYRCYCQIYQMTRSEQQTKFNHAYAVYVGRISREIAEQLIASCALRGYLAYAD